MRYWITVHWPHPTGGELPWHVYLRTKYKNLGDELRWDHRILFYQTAEAHDGGKILRQVTRIETGMSVPLQTKPHGLVGAGIATTSLRDRGVERIQFRYGDSDPFEWAHEAFCETDLYPKSIAHRNVKSVLGYSMFFPGGLRQIAEREYNELLRQLLVTNGKA